MKAVTATESPRIRGVYMKRLQLQHDARGLFMETFRHEWIPGARAMVQGNVSHSRARVLRGMHYHLRQADFWTVLEGSVQVGLFDLRQSSPTRGNGELFTLHIDKGLYIPAGVAHGFLTSSGAILHYLVDAYYDGTDEHGIAWDDPALELPWRVRNPIVSERDQKNPRLADIPVDRLPR
jgi:dTDP-4-dehydrorhamnose 3,5-epimerase